MILKIFKKDHGAVAAKDHELKRSPKWNGARKLHLSTFPHCQACHKPHPVKKVLHLLKAAVGLSPVQVHHIMPFHFCVLLGRPELELDGRNLVTLCESGFNHHLVIGHLNNFKTFNPNVITFAAKYLGWDDEKIKGDPFYMKALQARPKTWAEMTDDEKKGLRSFMDNIFPVHA